MLDNFIRKIEKARAAGKLTAKAVHVAHTVTCGVYVFGRCNCDPELGPDNGWRVSNRGSEKFPRGEFRDVVQ